MVRGCDRAGAGRWLPRIATETTRQRKRAILLLREVEGLTCEEIGASLGLAEGTVKSRLARARESLRRLLVPLERER